jgi:hypothetical protein
MISLNSLKNKEIKIYEKYNKVVTISNFFETLNLGKGSGRAH